MHGALLDWYISSNNINATDISPLTTTVDNNVLLIGYNITDNTGTRHHFYFTDLASNSGGDLLPWINDNSPLVEASGSTLRGVGGELGFDLFGNRLMFGVHAFTNEYKSSFNGKWNHTHLKYSGVNHAYGPFKLQIRYNWSNGYFENGFSLSIFNVQHNARPTISGISGTAYLFGGISGGVSFDAGTVMNTAVDYSNWYYKTTGTPWMISFH